MGSSKKHKDKDRDEKKHKHRDRDKERKHHKHKHRRSSKERDGEKKKRRRSESPDQISESPIRDVKHEPRVKEETQDKAAPAGEGTFHESLSIEETNKIRIKLGLAPLKVDKDVKEEEPSYSDRPDVHKPAGNLAARKDGDKIKEKLAMIREKRRLHKKLQKVKKIADDDDDEREDASAWVKKSRKLQTEKEKAEKQAKILQEMDEEFGISSLLDDELTKEKSEAYSAKDMAGLTVEHDASAFREGSSVILTLKDSGVLDEEGDTLVNYNLMDVEKAKKNIERKKKLPGYAAYDDTEEDEYGVMRPKALLSKYDEELEGERKKSFMLDRYGSVDTSADRVTDMIKESLRAQAVSLESRPLTVASEYYTAQEMDSFKKPRKKKRRLKKKNVVDELVAMQSQQKVDHGSRRRVEVEEGEIKEEENKIAAAAAASDINRQEEDMEVDMPDADESAIRGPDVEEDEWGPPIEDEAEKELQKVLHKARKLKQKKERKTHKVEEQVAAVVASIKVEPDVNGQEDSKPGSVVLHSTSEFCRTLGDIPTYGASGNREEDEEEEMDFEKDEEDVKEDFEEEVKGWNQVNPDEEDENNEEDIGPVLEEEPDIRPGCMGALSLAVKKGYLEQENAKNLGTVSGKNQHMEAQNFIVEDKNYNDIDAKYSKHDRYRGPLMDFKDKDGYTPDFKLTYIDETGRELNQKEAFRHLSHRFHGKGSGKLKTEKRLKKVLEEEAMKKMSSTDTPLHTVARMQEKQKEMQTPYIVLSGGGKNLATNPITK